MAFINLLTAVYPVGSVYFSTINNSPANIIGGTWQAISGLNLGLPTKSFRNDNGFRAFQLGNIVFFGGFGKRPRIEPWEKTSSVYHDDSLPKAYEPEGSCTNGGAVYSQDSGKSVWSYYDNNYGKIMFENKNDSETGEYYYGNLIYQTTPENTVTNNLDIYAWKRTA